MKRVLVPLDGGQFAATILPDARRLAGPDGELILVRDANWIRYEEKTGVYSDRQSVEEAESYLNTMAEDLRADGVRVEVHRLAPHDVARAIDNAATVFDADLIACATHGHGPVGRFWSGGVAWKALAHSPVPVLLRHAGEVDVTNPLPEPPQRRILVPLDGSPFGEAALPLATSLASEWNASIYLAQVISGLRIPDSPFQSVSMLPEILTSAIAKRRAYLDRIAQKLPGDVHMEVFLGPPIVEPLVNAIADWSITDVVMTSHGRTGMARVILGSIADELIHRLYRPIVVIPAFAAQRMKQPEIRLKEPAHTSVG